MASADGVLMWRLLGAVDGRHVAEVRDRLSAMRSRGDLAVSLLVVVSPFRWIPDTDVRTAATELLREEGDILKAVAVVFEARGFGAAALRAVMAAITAHVRRPFPVKLSGEIAEAATWLSERDSRSAAAMLELIGESVGLAPQGTVPK